MATLKSELIDDPEGIGYAEMADDAARAESLNAKNREVNVVSVTGQQLFEAIDPEELAELTDRQEARVMGIVGMGTILVNGTNTKAALLAIFVGGTTTRANLAALQKQTVSRAVELKLGKVRVGDVQRARA